LRIGHRAHFKRLQDALMDAGADPIDQLRAMTHAHVDGHMEYPSMARLTNRELRTVLTIRSQTEQLFIDVLDRGVRMGVFAPTDTFLAAKAIGAMGIRLPEWWSEQGPRTREQICEHYVAYAVKLVM
jgi:hypothetical protein